MTVKFQCPTFVEREVVTFFDFYAMYELYLRVGGYREIGYNTYDGFVGERAFFLIKEKYEATVDNFYQNIYDALTCSVGDEAYHFPKYCCGYDSRREDKFYKSFQRLTGFTCDQTNEAKCDPSAYLNVLHAMFSVPWQIMFGGKKWADATEFLINARNIRHTHEKVIWCDRVIDLYHNTGHLLDKTDFYSLSECSIRRPNSLSISPLEFKTYAKSAMEFVPYVSSGVKRLLIPHSRLLLNNHIS
jgi:hypothetical protein